MPKNDSISMSVIRRLPRYYRFLSELSDQGVDKISSTKLAQIMNVTASQVRQDLNCFGGFGQQGYGYSVSGPRSPSTSISRGSASRLSPALTETSKKSANSSAT